MERRFRRAIVALALAGAVQLPIAGQESFRPKRTPEGYPDIQGIWMVMNTAAWNIQDHHAEPGVPAGQGVVEGNEIPYLPSALAKLKENRENRAKLDPNLRCFIPGTPRIMYMRYPLHIVQGKDHALIVFEYIHNLRTIYTNGSPHQIPDIQSWLGDSRGHYDSNSLVVDVTNFNGKTWFDAAGNYHSDALHLVERFTPIGPDHLRYEVTVEDPKVFSRPWKMNMIMYRIKEPNARVLEYECVD